MSSAGGCWGHSANNVWTPPRLNLVSLYTEQVPKNDMSRDLAARHGFRIHPKHSGGADAGHGKIGGGRRGVCRRTRRLPDQRRRPEALSRFELFNQILDVYERSGRSVPTFFDKHFSYDWTKAEALFRRARRLQTPLLAGSSLPVTSRAPHLQPKLETRMTHAAAIGYGPLDAYGFHLLETLQCLVERRAAARRA
jgi:hypothetical protein